ncbi:MAG: hypothetical protein JRH07_16840 [Deltaproteobacteria bacterium]|nr:hypothetical protein [Deltaproteobacteria bacterium]MBW2123488.1 hypothetical protein [Deltaproteobacteria bacterium]
MRKADVKPFVWGVVVGGIVLLIVIFSTGWVVTRGSAQAKAEQMAERAVVDYLAPICVAQFLEDPNKEERLKELKEMNSWKRGDYVKEIGWATMPGSKSPDREVADECARRLMKLEE